LIELFSLKTIENCLKIAAVDASADYEDEDEEPDSSTSCTLVYVFLIVLRNLPRKAQFDPSA